MPTQLHLLLGEHTVHWLCRQSEPMQSQPRSSLPASHDNTPAQDMGSVSLEQLDSLATRADACQVIAYLPGSVQMETEITLPVHKPGPAMQALPFALEDRFASPPEEMHFSALQSRRISATESSHRVVAVAHQDMKGWLERLASAGIQADRLLPATDFLSRVDAQSACLCLDADWLWIRPGQAPGMIIETGLLDALMPKLAHTLSATNPATGTDSGTDQATLFVCTGSDAQQQEALVQALAIRHVQTLSSNNPLQVLQTRPTDAGQRKHRNLLTGPYQPDRALRERVELWRPAAAMAALLFLVVYIQEHMELSRLETRSQALDQQNHALLKEAAPHITRIVDPLAQLRQEVARREAPQITGARLGFIDQLGRIGPGLTASAGAPKAMKLRNIQYRDGHLELELSVPTVAALDQLQTVLRQRATGKVTLLSSSSTEQQVIARLRIESGNPLRAHSDNPRLSPRPAGNRTWGG